MTVKTFHLLRNTLALAFGITLALAVLPRTRTAEAISSTVTLSEVYGGGGNSGATYTHDFIELYNLSGSPVSLAGWSVQYVSATGSGTWLVTPITGTIAAGRYFLVQEAQGAGGTTPLPTPDITGTIAMGGTAGKVALVNTTTALTGACPSGAQIIDLVGYGTTANCFEGTGPTPAPSNTTSAIRAGGGATDTDNNSTDFATGAPDPDNSQDAAPSVSASVPMTGTFGVALSANVTITFSEAVTVTGSWFGISCANSGAHTAAVTGGPANYTLDPDTDFTATELCTVTVESTLVNDQDTEDPPDNMAADHVFSFTTIDAIVCGNAAVFIHAVQGSGTSSPMEGASGVEIEAIVVGDYQNTTSEFSGFYLQEDDGEADVDPLTSEGIFVFDDDFGVAVAPGDKVRVKGSVDEVFAQTQLMTVTAMAVCSTGNTVTTTDINLPVAAIADLERYEGMQVRFPQELSVTETFTLGRFGEVWLSVNGRLYTPTNVVPPGAPAIALQNLNDRSRILLDDGNNQQNIDPTRYPFGGLSASNTLREGDTVDDLTGVLGYAFGDYRIQPTGTITFTAANPRPATSADVGGELRVAAMNVLNYFNGNGLGGGFPTSRGADTLAEFNRQRTKTITAVVELDADVIGLMEIENDAAGNSAIEDLVAGLNAATAPGTYAYIDTGVVGTDEIRVALIYKPASATPVGDFELLTSAVNPLFIDTLNRPALAQTFEADGSLFTVVVNHLKSKGSPCSGDPDTGDGQGNCNVTRTNAATALVDWLGDDPTGSGDPDFLVIGDLNAYALEDPIGVFTNATYSNLINQFVGAEAYSYVFDGQSGYLDHALATPSLAAQVTGAAEWHINADEPTVLDYNVEFKTANHVNTLYAPDEFRSSDHDPLVVGLSLNDPPTVSANGPYTVSEGASVNVSATGDDPNGDTLTYAWDLDNNGSYETPGQNASFSALTLDGPTTATIGVEAGDGALTATAQTTVTVLNAAPQVAAPVVSPEPSLRQFSVTASSVFTDIVADAPFSCTVDYGDGTAVVGGTISTTTCLGPSHVYTLTGSYSVTVSVTDKDSGVGANTALHTVTDGTTFFFPLFILGSGSSAANSNAPVEAARAPEVWKSSQELMPRV